MRKSVLIGLDGSAWSSSAVELGIQWAGLLDAELIGMAIVDEPTICKAEPVSIGGGAFKERRDARKLADARKRVREFGAAFTARCQQAGVAYRVLEETGLPSELILAEAADADLTMLGLQTHFHFETQLTACETLKAVLHLEERPVVAVPHPLPTGRSIVVAYDASPPSVRALEAFQRLRLDAGRPVYVVSVAQDLDSASRRASDAAQFLNFFGIQAHPQPFKSSGAPAESIVDAARQLDARMVVMGAYGNSSQWFAKSTTSAILRQTNRVLFCHH